MPNRGQRHPGRGVVFFPALLQDSSIPAQQQIVTGAGASSFGFIDGGAALLVFQGTGASVVGFADAGAALETFLGGGLSVVRLVDGGAGIAVIPIIGSGASTLAFSSAGAGATVGDVVGGGGGFSFDWDRAFPQKKQQRNKRKPTAERSRTPPEIFSYASESALFVAGSGSGVVSMLAAGSSRVNVRGSGAGRMEESATEVIGLLLMSDEL